MGGKEEGRKEIYKKEIYFCTNIQRRKEKKGEEKRKKKFYINLFFQGTRVSLYLLVFI